MFCGLEMMVYFGKASVRKRKRQVKHIHRSQRKSPNGGTETGAVCHRVAQRSPASQSAGVPAQTWVLRSHYEPIKSDSPGMEPRTSFSC